MSYVNLKCLNILLYTYINTYSKVLYIMFKTIHTILGYATYCLIYCIIP